MESYKVYFTDGTEKTFTSDEVKFWSGFMDFIDKKRISETVLSSEKKNVLVAKVVIANIKYIVPVERKVK